MESIEKIINIPGTHMSNVFGQFDSHLKVIEKALSVDVVVRGESVKVIGSESAVTKAARALEQLSALARSTSRRFPTHSLFSWKTRKAL